MNLKKYLVITTINEYASTSIEEYSKYDYNIIVVGDKKTLHESYLNKNLAYIHPENDIFHNFSSLLPFNHYSRKNIGYLYAINNNADLLFDTDDDNFPLDNFDSWNQTIENSKTILSPKIPNIMSLFTTMDIWARGFPLELIQKKEPIKTECSNANEIDQIGIIQSLAKGDPDVDAVYRLTNKNYNSDIIFDENKAFICKKNIFTQGNTQATIWKDKKLFHLLYIPSTVSFRFCDILKMYVAQKCMWKYDKLFCYVSPIVKQDRNEHNYMNDFISEYSMYKSVFHIINNIFDKIQLNGDSNDLLVVYKKLHEEGIVKELELKLIEEWLKLVNIQK